MQRTIILRLALFCLLLVVALRRTSVGPEPESKDKPASAKAHQLLTTTHVSPTLPTSLQVQPSHAILLAAAAETDSDRRGEALESAVQLVSDADLPALLASLALDPRPVAAEASLLLVRRWAESDPPAAAAWTSRLPDSPLSRAVMEQVAIAWANTDLPEASGWVQTWPEGDPKFTATLSLAYEASRTDPVAALELAHPLPPTRERDDLMVHAISQWTGTDAAHAAIWALNVPDPALQQRLVGSVAIVLSEQDPPLAVTLALNGLEAGDEQDRTAVSIVQRWAQSAPEAAASWVAQLPDLPSRDAALQNLLALWTAQDAEAADRWVRQLSDGPLQEVGRTAYDQALGRP